MQICPRCNKSRPIEERIQQDPKTLKHWLITRCQTCHFAFDLEEWGKVRPIKK